MFKFQQTNGISIIFIFFLFFIAEYTAQSAEYKNIIFHKISFTIADINLKKDTLRLFWKSPTTGKPFISIEALQKWLEKTGQQLEMATNAGIYEIGNMPLGLYIENSQILIPLNQNQGMGNFYLKPNGIFVMGDKKASILESSQFSSIKWPIHFATQSGPLLLINRKIHPSFNKNSTNNVIRNGVGISSTHHIIIAISNAPVSLYDFALLFRDYLKCDNALYLDGVISKMYIPKLNRMEKLDSFAALFAVITQTKQNAQ
ncbi:MAG: hypothetical protein RL637_1896 [Pseudomonadota bacterium]|jgi:uncharacterized protein YigE (DUF2233 family)